MAGSEPFRLYPENDKRILRQVEPTLAEQRAQELEGLLVSESWEDFKQRKGKIDGLDLAIRICQEIKENLGIA